MKIVSSAVAMQSQHYAMLRTEEHESLSVRITPSQREAAPVAAPAPGVDDAAQEGKRGEALDWRLQLIRNFIEWLTGKPVDVFDASQLKNSQAGDANVAAAPSSASATDVPRSAGIGIEYEYHASREELEKTAFAAQGAVATADGRQIAFTLGVGMSRSYSEHTDVSLRAGDAAQRKDPLVLNLGGAATQLSGERMNFDLDADGKAEAVPLLTGGSVFLALDRNSNGKIDSGAELFGPATGSGFAELAKYDSDGNGWIDESDPVFQQLRLWKPEASGGGQLASLKDRDVGALYLGHEDTPFELRSAQNEDLGAVRTSGVYLGESGGAGSIQQIDLTV